MSADSPEGIIFSSIENILLDGLNKTSIFDKVTLFHKVGIFDKQVYWNYLKNITKCLPSTEDFIESIKSNKDVQTDLGRGRNFIFSALNQHLLGSFLESLKMDNSLTNSFYLIDSNAFIAVSFYDDLGFLSFNINPFN